MNNFTWGKIITSSMFKDVEIIEYFPRKFVNGREIKGELEYVAQFYVPWLNESFPSYDIAVIAILCRERLGLNNHLAYPIARMLCMLECK